MQFLFADHTLDTDRRELRRGSKPIAVEPQVFDLLLYLMQNRDRVVTKDDLIASVWGGRIVSDSTLTSRINAARRAVGDSGGDQKLIRTVARKGVRFVGAVREGPDAAPAVATEPQRPPLALPDRPSIAVLPFVNMSESADQDYFIDGMVEDVITGLSRIKWLFVIARNSSFCYRGKTIDLRQVGRELGVRYVLEGSARKAGNRVRISVQLVEAETRLNLWVGKYDRLLDDVFDLQDELAMSVVGAIEPALRRAEIDNVKRKRPESLDAYDFVLRAMAYVRSRLAADAAAAIPLLENALELEPGYPAAHAFLALCHHAKFHRGGMRPEDRAAAIFHARACANDATDDATALGISGFVISLDEQDHATAYRLFDRALNLSSNDIFTLWFSANALAFRAEAETAIERAQRALQLSPFDPLNFLAYNALATSYLVGRRVGEAHEASRRSLELNGRFSVSHSNLVASLVGLGRLEDARLAGKRLLEFDPTFSIRRFAMTFGTEPKVFAFFADAWRKAGIPEG